MDQEANRPIYNRREFLQTSGKGIIGATLASLIAAQATGCGSQAALSGAGKWEALRFTDFTVPLDDIYANHSTLGTTSRTVQQRMLEVNQIFAQGCSVDRFVSEIVLSLSPIFASFVALVNGHVDPTTTGRYAGFVASVTEGMSLIANGLAFRAGDVIVTTDHEHSGAFTMWKLQADRYGAFVLQVPLLDPADTETTWSANLTERFRQACLHAPGPVRVVSFPVIPCSTGHILPVKELCAVAKSFGAVSVVDAAQAFAVIPLDVQAFDCDALVVNGHKYLCGPVGSGFITVHPRLIETLSSFWPTIVDEHYYNPDNPRRNYPYRKGGVSAYTNILPLAEALALVFRLGMDEIANRLTQIGDRFRRSLAAYPDRFELITPQAKSLSSVMTCFRIRGIASETVYETLRDQYRIQCKHATEGYAADAGGTVNGAVRLSPNYYISEGELQKITKALYDIAGIG